MSNSYIEKSLELHLFFARIMKEHSLFLKAGFTSADMCFSKKAESYKNEFEHLLLRAVSLSNGVFNYNLLNSGEFVTEFTEMAEKQTEYFTGIAINQNITRKEKQLNSGCDNRQRAELYQEVKMLNQKSIVLLNGLITFKENILNRVLNCQMFTMNYPLLLEHIIREAKLYRSYVLELEKCGKLNEQSMKDIECFWNQIMMEHALFIRGLLDPTENELIHSADEFSYHYSELLENSQKTHDSIIKDNALSETLKFRDFKAAGTEGIEKCKIRSLILPLLADHVLREANHYIRLLKE